MPKPQHRPATPQAASGTITVEVDGRPIGTAGVINFQSATGLIQGCSYNAAAARVDCMPAADSAVLLTNTADLQGKNHTLIATSTAKAGVTYAATTASPITGYTQGQYFIFFFDVAPQPGATMNIDGIGPLPIQPTCGTPCFMTVIGNPPSLLAGANLVAP